MRERGGVWGREHTTKLLSRFCFLESNCPGSQMHKINFSKQLDNAGNEANVVVVELHITVGVHCNVHDMHVC